jgi:hypothetical protein
MSDLEPTEAEVFKYHAVLLPFVQEYRLPLNPEDLDLMAHALLRYGRSDASYEEIDQVVRREIAEHFAAADQMNNERWRPPGDDRP